MDSKEWIQELREKAEKDLLGSVLIRGPRLSELLSLLDSQQSKLDEMKKNEAAVREERIDLYESRGLVSGQNFCEMQRRAEAAETKLDEQSKEIERMKRYIEAIRNEALEDAARKIESLQLVPQSMVPEFYAERVRSIKRIQPSDSKRGVE